MFGSGLRDRRFEGYNSPKSHTEIESAIIQMP